MNDALALERSSKRFKEWSVQLGVHVEANRHYEYTKAFACFGHYFFGLLGECVKIVDDLLLSVVQLDLTVVFWNLKSLLHLCEHLGAKLSGRVF